jgi:hypothetical protein
MLDNLEPVYGSGEKGAERSVSDFEESETVIADRPGWGSFLRRQLPYIWFSGSQS